MPLPTFTTGVLSSPPTAVANAQVDTKADWSDSWTAQPTIIPAAGNLAAAAGGQSRATFTRRYGLVNEPGGARALRTALDLNGYWVRVRFDATTAWIGKIASETRQVDGASNGATGTQTWTAYGGDWLLGKIRVAGSYWENETTPGEPTLAGWLPGMNARDETRGRAFRDLAASTIGNRSEDHTGGAGTQEDWDTYVYGGADTWNNHQYAEYVLRRFAESYDETAAEWTGPRWRLTGETTALANLTDVIPWPASISILDMLRRLIPRSKGLDFVVRPAATADGWDIEVYSLAATASTFDTWTLPANTNTTSLPVAIHREVQPVTLEANDAAKCGRIRVFGGRVVVCMSLYGSGITKVNTPDGWVALPSKYAGTLVGRWDSTLETAYKTAAGAGATAIENDTFRGSDHFAPVYRHFGAPDDFDFFEGDGLPWLDTDGTWDETATDPPDQQTHVRRTLSWLPLKNGFDYSADPAVDNSKSDTEPGLVEPGFWVADRFLAIDGRTFKPAEALGIGISTPAEDWGVHLRCAPGHLLARNDWSGAQASMVSPWYDYRYSVATIAVETDQRLALVYDIPGRHPTDGVLDIEVDDAAYWFLAPYTVVGLASDGTLATSGDEGRELRQDRSRLGVALAGHLARFYASRGAASIGFKGLYYMGDLVGNLLASTYEGADILNINAPITNWSWRLLPKPTTAIRSGFA